MSRRALSLTVLALLVLGLLAWLGRGGPGQFRPEGVTPPGTVDPRFQCTLASFPAVPTVGEPFRLKLTVQGDVALNEEEGSLLVGFPHPYYALRAAAPGEPFPPAPPDLSGLKARTVGGSLTPTIRQVGYGRWYIDVPLRRSIAAGRVVEVDVAGLRAPNRPLDRFEPLLLLDPNGDEDFWRLCPELSVPVQAGPATSLSAVLPSRIAPDSALDLTVRRQDVYGNPVGEVSGPYTVRWRPPVGRAAEVEVVAELEPTVTGVGRARIMAPPEGAWVATVFEGTLESGGQPLRGRSNAVLVEPDPPLLGWADLQGHSSLGDGWGTPADWYRHAREVAVLDAAALSERDWQLDPGDVGQLLGAAAAAHDPPRFVTVPALGVKQGGREVAYLFEPSRMPPDGHAAGGVTTFWAETDVGYPAATFAPPLGPILADPSVERVTHTSIVPAMGTAFPRTPAPPNWHVLEVYSAHGSSECQDCPRSAWQPPTGKEAPSGGARDALAAGHRLGFIASGDTRDGRPGTSRWGAHSGGLGAIYWTEASRAGLQTALQQRRVYGTTGSRTIVDFVVDGVDMGGVVDAALEHRLRFRVIDAQPIRSVTLVRDGVEWATVDAPIGWQEVVDSDPAPSSWYLRAELQDGNLAWSSPVFVD